MIHGNSYSKKWVWRRLLIQKIMYKRLQQICWVVCWISTSVEMWSFLVSTWVTNAALAKSLFPGKRDGCLREQKYWRVRQVAVVLVVTQCLFCFCYLTEGLWCRWCCRTVISCCCGYWFWHNIQWLRLQLNQGTRMYSCNEVRAAMQHLVFDRDNMDCLQ